MTSIPAFFRKTPLNRLQDYFTRTPLPSLPPIDWTKPEPEVIGPLIKAVDDMSPEDRQRIILDAGRVAALADEPGQNALQNVVRNRTAFDELEGPNNRSLWVFLNEPERFRMAEEVRYNDERRRGRLWSGFEVEKDRTVRKDPASVSAFTAAIRDRFDTANVQVDVFDRHRVILDNQECDLVQIAIYREGRAEDMLTFGEDTKITRNVVYPVFEAAMTYEAATGVIEVVASNRDDRLELTRYMAKHLLGIDFEERHVPFREYDLGILLKPFDFPSDMEDGIESVTVKELRLMDLGDPKERVTLEVLPGCERTIWDMARRRIGLGIGSGMPGVFPEARAADVPSWIVTRARFTIRFRAAREGARGKSLTLIVTMPHGCNLKDMTPHERLIGEKYLRRWGILKDDLNVGRG